MSTRTTHRHLRHALGYIGLGMVEQARAELALIPREDWAAPEVLAARIELHTLAKEWDLVIGFGDQFASRHPELEAGWIGWAYALRELQRFAEAKAVLLEADQRHGNTSALLNFNLACYHCLLGEMDQAKDRLNRACRLDATLKASALHDPDLEPLWTHIAAL